jgi:hypothetical protein
MDGEYCSTLCAMRAARADDAEMTMVTDESGHMLELDGTAGPVPVDDKGDVYTDRFRWLVTEMRVAE